MVIVKGLDNIRAAQTVKFPTHDDVRLRFPGYTAGWIVAMYHHGLQKWIMSYHETREEALDVYKQHKEVCEMLPDVFNWLEYSEMYVYHSRGYRNAKWSLMFMVTEE